MGMQGLHPRSCCRCLGVDWSSDQLYPSKGEGGGRACVPAMSLLPSRARAVREVPGVRNSVRHQGRRPHMDTGIKKRSVLVSYGQNPAQSAQDIFDEGRLRLVL